MIYVEAPNDFVWKINPDNYLPGRKILKVFLAGGITGTPDWQTEIMNTLKIMPDNLVLFNPRRKNFPIHDSSAAETQIRWEFNKLREAHLISFWFPKETLNPIVLFELGAHSTTDKPLVVGVHPQYARKQDVEIQMSLVRPHLKIVYSLDEVVEGIKSFL
jgi:hypothetical protein